VIADHAERGDRRIDGLVTAEVGEGCGRAVVGGLVVRGLNLLPWLDAYAISARDIVSAIAGSAVILLAWWLYLRRQAKAN
jgi:hypothetical protein